MTQVAVFFVDFGHPDYRRLGDAMIASVRRHLPDARIMQMTDAGTAPFDGVDRVMRSKAAIAAGEIMPYRIGMTARVAEQTEDDVIFVDPDVEFLGPVPPLDPACDVGLTVRRAPGYHGMPFNTGVMVSRPTDAARRFWRHVERTVLSLRPREQLFRWWGDQLAIALTVGVAAVQDAETDVIETAGIRVKLLDEAVWNCPAEPGETPDGALIVHYKGERKRAAPSEP